MWSYYFMVSEIPVTLLSPSSEEITSVEGISIPFSPTPVPSTSEVNSVSTNLDQCALTVSTVINKEEFLTGFHKRKLQRKKKAQEEFEQQLKEERKRLQLEARESYKKLVVSHRPIPELENLASKKYELENHSVNITELSASDLAEKNLWIGTSKVIYEDESSENNDQKDTQKDELTRLKLKTPKDVKKILKKNAKKQVQKSKTFKLKNKLERQKNKKESLKKKKKRKGHSKSRQAGKKGKR
ncbi:nucleolar protein 12-like isoform X2 [Periplaneta americana]|uniref:nucleolar protein 12-like isoform X2 n=1 Tax=Periplaneta americana TaxID=6978 RepID=UPI0037E90DAD